jgi:hypothetical protein
MPLKANKVRRNNAETRCYVEKKRQSGMNFKLFFVFVKGSFHVKKRNYPRTILEFSPFSSE